MHYIGFPIYLILLWLRPEYRFLLFYATANTALVLLFTVWSLTPEDAVLFATILAISDAFLLVLGALVVALRKWLKTRKTGRDRQLDKDMDRIRAAIAARESQQ